MRIIVKRLLFVLGCISFLSVVTPVSADTQKPITVDQLPKESQSFIKQYFPNEKIALVSMEKDFLETTYKVIFSNSTKVEFRKDGEWKEVDCKFLSVPTGIIPDGIEKKVKDLYPTLNIVEVDKSKRDYEVKLSSGMELTFDLKNNLIEIDD